MTLEEFRQKAKGSERLFVLGALEQCEWFVDRAARKLAVSPPVLRRIIVKHGLDRAVVAGREYRRNAKKGTQ